MVKEIIYHEKSSFRFIKHKELDEESIGYMINKIKSYLFFQER